MGPESPHGTPHPHPCGIPRHVMGLFRVGGVTQARKETSKKFEQDMKRGDVYAKDARLHAKQGKKAPLEAVPGVRHITTCHPSWDPAPPTPSWDPPTQQPSCG